MGLSLGLAVLGGSREGVDSSALVFLVSWAMQDRKEEEKKLKEKVRMEQIEDRICEGAPVSAADTAAWRRWATADEGAPVSSDDMEAWRSWVRAQSSSSRCKEEEEEEEEEKAAETFLLLLSSDALVGSTFGKAVDRCGHGR